MRESLEIYEPTAFQERLSQREQAAGLTDAEIKDLPREELYQRLYATIGNTPLVAEEYMNGNVILYKDETANPTETHYDRCFAYLIHCLEQEGTISPGDTLLETSSGSAGISFAWICKKLGYRSVVFMPSTVPEPRRIETEALADEVHYGRDPSRYMASCAEDMIQYLRDNREKVKAQGHKIWLPNHSQDPRTLQAFATVAHEVTQQVPVDYFIGGIGNGSTLVGIGQALKQINPDTNVIGYEPQRACPYYKKYRDRWGTMPEILPPLHDHEVSGNYQPSHMIGSGSTGEINFPFMEMGIQQGIIDDVVVVLDGPHQEALIKFWNETRSPENQFGRTSIISEYQAKCLQVTSKTILALRYDKIDRYHPPYPPRKY